MSTRKHHRTRAGAHHEDKVTAQRQRVFDAQFFEGPNQNVAAFFVLITLRREEVVLLRLLKSDSDCLLQGRVGAEDDTCCRSKGGSNDVSRPDEPADTPSRSSEGF